jgi:hypothetical protein
MKILKEIQNMFEKLPSREKDIFIQVFGQIEMLNAKKHKEKEIIYNLLLWRVSI